jgi:hypothetical protein
MASLLRDQFDRAALVRLGGFSSYAVADDASSFTLADADANQGRHINNKRRSIDGQARPPVLRQEVLSRRRGPAPGRDDRTAAAHGFLTHRITPRARCRQGAAISFVQRSGDLQSEMARTRARAGRRFYGVDRTRGQMPVSHATGCGRGIRDE